MYYATPLPHLPLQVPQSYVDKYVKLFGDEEPYVGNRGIFFQTVTRMLLMLV